MANLVSNLTQAFKNSDKGFWNKQFYAIIEKINEMIPYLGGGSSNTTYTGGSYININGTTINLKSEEFKNYLLNIFQEKLIAGDNIIIEKKADGYVISATCEGGSSEQKSPSKLVTDIQTSTVSPLKLRGLIWLNPQNNAFFASNWPFIATEYNHSPNEDASNWLGQDYDLECKTTIIEDLNYEFCVFKKQNGEFIIFNQPTNYEILNDPRRYIINGSGEIRNSRVGYQFPHFRIGDKLGPYVTSKTLTDYKQLLYEDLSQVSTFYDFSLNQINADRIKISGAFTLLGTFKYGGSKCEEITNATQAISSKLNDIKLQLTDSEGQKIVDEYGMVLSYDVETQKDWELGVICGIVKREDFFEKVKAGQAGQIIEDMLLNDYDPRLLLIKQKTNERLLKNTVLEDFGGRIQFFTPDDYKNKTMLYRLEDEDSLVSHSLKDIIIDMLAPFIEDSFGPRMPWEEDSTGWEYTEEDGKITFTGANWTNKNYRKPLKDLILGTNKSYIKYGENWANGGNNGLRKIVRELFSNYSLNNGEERFNYIIEKLRNTGLSLSSTLFNLNTFARKEMIGYVNFKKLEILYEYYNNESIDLGCLSPLDQYITNSVEYYQNLVLNSISDNLMPRLNKTYVTSDWNNTNDYIFGYFRNYDDFNTAYGTLDVDDVFITMRNSTIGASGMVVNLIMDGTQFTVGGGYIGYTDNTLVGLDDFDGEIYDGEVNIAYQETINDSYSIGIGTIERFGGHYGIGAFKSNKEYEIESMSAGSVYSGLNINTNDGPYVNPKIYFMGKEIETSYNVMSTKTNLY